MLKKVKKNEITEEVNKYTIYCAYPVRKKHAVYIMYGITITIWMARITSSIAVIIHVLKLFVQYY